MYNIVFFGPPGAGKGTQCTFLVDRYELIHISVGNLLREEVERGSALGQKVRNYINEGEFVPHEIIVQLVGEKMEAHRDAKGFLFDGYPRTREQAEGLDHLLNLHQRSLDKVFFLQVTLPELLQRIQLRGKRLHRVDDQDIEKIRRRLELYHACTLPIADLYEAQEKLVRIEGEGAPEEIAAQIAAILQEEVIHEEDTQEAIDEAIHEAPHKAIHEALFPDDGA